MFLPLAALVTVVGVIVTTKGPSSARSSTVRRPWGPVEGVTSMSFLLSKLVAYGIGFGIVALIIPWVVFLAEDRFIAGNEPALLPMLGASGIVGAAPAGHLALVIALGTWFDSRGPIVAIAIGVRLTGQFFGGIFSSVRDIAALDPPRACGCRSAQR